MGKVKKSILFYPYGTVKGGKMGVNGVKFGKCLSSYFTLTLLRSGWRKNSSNQNPKGSNVGKPKVRKK
jgi:hypothetical protein